MSAQQKMISKQFVFILFLVGCCLYAQSQLTNGAYYKIKNGTTSKYIQVQGDNNDNGANAIINDYVDENYFKWQAIEVTRGVFKFKNAGSGKCLGIGGGSRAVGAI